MEKIGNACGAAGLMGNLYAESALRPNNLQNSYEKKLGMTDESYTAAVDNGSYTNFVKDSAGYGLAQWTYHTRKAALLDYAKSIGASIGDLDAQLGFLWKELSEGYSASVLAVLKTATTVREASDVVLTKFERPADQSEAAKIRRAGYGQTYYNKYANVTGSSNTDKEEDNMSYTNSSLASVTLLSPNHSGQRTHTIDTITIHCFVAQVTAKRGCEVFQPTSKKASCNYVVGYDGSIGLCVEEKNRSWCTSSNSNDQRAITIEVASDNKDPYAVTDKAYNALLELVTDICKRNDIKKLVWSTNKNERMNHLNGCNMTVHRDYANKSCPGAYLYERHGQIAAEVNRRLGTTEDPVKPSIPDTGSATVKKGDTVRILSGATYYSGKAIPAWVAAKEWIVQEVSGDRAVIDKSVDGKNAICSPINVKFLSVVGGTATQTPSFSAYLVKITTDALNIRKGPGTGYGLNGCIRDRGVYTIVAESTGTGATKWGKLKSGAGWISLDYTQKV